MDVMKSEWTRLRSFNIRPNSQWSISYVSPEELANAGFFYLNDDRVQCAFCMGVVSNWEPGDRPLAEHARHFPRCPFIMEQNVGNVPLSHDPILGSKSVGHDVCGNFAPEMMINPVINSINNNGEDKYSNINMKDYGIQPHRGPKSPNFKSYESRKRSFLMHGWDNKYGSTVSISQLVDAGFYSIGMEDYVKCFYCDGGLCNWETGDDPWVEHAKWFPECGFVSLIKSTTFVEECRKLNEDQVLGHSSSQESGFNSVTNYETVSQPSVESSQITNQELSNGSEYNSEMISPNSLVEPTHDPEYESDIISSEIGSQSSQSSTVSTLSSSPPDSLGSQMSDSSDDNRLLCKICLDREIGVVFLPCGHQLACTQCAPCISYCPICRKIIRGTVRTFFS